MIKLLGFRRTLILGIMLAINAVLAAVYFMWAAPETQGLNQQLNGLRAQISTLQTNIQNTKADMKFLQENITTYEQYIASGFFQEQDRFGMSRALEEIKTGARIQGFSFSVGDISEIQNPDAQAAEKRLLHSRVSIDNISAVTDINFFDLLTQIENNFPTHARVQSFELSRSGELTQDMLNQVAAGPFSLISGQVVFDWLSLGRPATPATGAPVTPGGF